MAWETGTAADHVDLFNKIRDFLTANVDLVNAGENWTQELGPTGTLVHGDQITLRGSGTTGNENIYFGMQTVQDTTSEIFNIRFWGHAAFSNTLGPRDQASRSGDRYVYCWDQPMTYWIVGNSRRWMLAVKVSTVYSVGYCGFYLPYAAPSEYPYPMVVAGMSYFNQRWSTQDERCRFFASPGYAGMNVYFPDNVWRTISNYKSNTSNPIVQDGVDQESYGYVFPTREYSDAPALDSPAADSISETADKCFDGNYLLRDLIIMSSGVKGPYYSLMGVMDGAYWVPGRGNSSENIVTKDGVDHLVVQNLFRTGFRDYMAMRLE